MNDSLKMDMLFAGELLSITSVDHDDSSIQIKMPSKTHYFKCLGCGQETETLSWDIFTQGLGSADSGKNSTAPYNSS